MKALKGLKGFHKTFWDTTKKCENKKFNLTFISLQLLEMLGRLRVKRGKNKAILIMKYATSYKIHQFWAIFETQNLRIASSRWADFLDLHK